METHLDLLLALLHRELQLLLPVLQREDLLEDEERGARDDPPRCFVLVAHAQVAQMEYSGRCWRWQLGRLRV